ncbi:hypothetical protein GNZ12_34930 [Paraburkholderia sp. 1N]|uniref:Uncharacterized protein n=1 Tax=Paraburkholderia solitsugae TaxID=2675748 RepID=A0ABX2C024_9BURK|nr:hypothetical protein [Paraburkholderia solitsugae]NPT46427.1 hypothetical protein [Paraburkholderia solitsugae]
MEALRHRFCDALLSAITSHLPYTFVARDSRHEENCHSGAEERLAVADWTYAFIAAGLGQGCASRSHQSREGGGEPDCAADGRRNLPVYGPAAQTWNAVRRLVVAGCASAVRAGDRAFAKIKLVHFRISCLELERGAGLQVFALSGAASHGHEHV